MKAMLEPLPGSRVDSATVPREVGEPSAKGFVELLPIAAIVIASLLPIGYFGLPLRFTRYLSPAVLIMLAFAGVRFSHRHPSSVVAGRARVIGLAVAFVLSFETVMSSDFQVSAFWSLAVAVCVLLPVYVGPNVSNRLINMIAMTIAVLSMLCCGLALVELATGWNPYTHLYSADVDDRVWSVFRAKVTFGHPLTTMTVGSTWSAFLVISWVTSGKKLYLFGGVASAVMVALTASRTGVYALGGGYLIAVVTLLIVAKRPAVRQRVGTVVVLSTSLLIGVLASPFLRDRSDASEALKSTSYRSNVFDLAVAQINMRGGAGVGPGLAQQLFADSTGQTLENSLLQLVLDLGVVGAVIVIAFLISVLVTGVNAGAIGSVAGIVAFFVAISGFNALDANPALLVIVMPLLLTIAKEDSVHAFAT